MSNYPNGTPSTVMSGIWSEGNYTPQDVTAYIKDHFTPVNHNAIMNSVGLEISKIENFVNSTYLGRSDVRVENAYFDNVLVGDTVNHNSSGYIEIEGPLGEPSLRVAQNELNTNFDIQISGNTQDESGLNTITYPGVILNSDNSNICIRSQGGHDVDIIAETYFYDGVPRNINLSAGTVICSSDLTCGGNVQTNHVIADGSVQAKTSLGVYEDGADYLSPSTDQVFAPTKSLLILTPSTNSLVNIQLEPGGLPDGSILYVVSKRSTNYSEAQFKIGGTNILAAHQTIDIGTAAMFIKIRNWDSPTAPADSDWIPMRNLYGSWD